jgi:hypothetical protein
MRRLALLLPLLIVAGCAAPETRGPTRESEALQRDLAGRTAGASTSCIPATGNQGLTIVDPRTLAYDQGRTIWVNRLEADCPGMRPMDTLIVELHGSQYCRGDHFRATSTGNTIPGPICVLGDFTPYRR